MSDVDEIVGMVAGLETWEDCKRVRDAAQTRIKELSERAHQRRVTERWATLERCKPGTVLYLAQEGITIGGSLQRGDSLKVVWVDKESERICVRYHRIRGKLSRSQSTYVLDPTWAERYRLQRERPDKPTTEDERRMGAKLGKMFEGVEK